MNKKIMIVFCTLLLLVSTISLNVKDNGNVKATGGAQENSVNLDTNYIWDRLNDLADVVNKSYDSNDIPMGRAWASKGENYTIDEILYNEIGKANNPCGLSGYQTLQLGYVSEENGQWKKTKTDKEYTTKINFRDFNLTLHDNNDAYHLYVPKKELFPFGCGVFPFGPDIFYRTHFPSCLNIGIVDGDQTTIPSFSFNDLPEGSYYNISVDLLNIEVPNYFIGEVRYIESNQTIPQNQSFQVYIMDEEPNCSGKIENLTFDAGGSILIENKTKGYNFKEAMNCSNLSCGVARVARNNTDFNQMLSEYWNGTNFTAIYWNDTHSVFFINQTYTSMVEKTHCVVLFQLQNESQGSGFAEIATKNYLCYIENWLPIGNYFYHAFILAGPDDTHFMLPTQYGWTGYNLEYGVQGGTPSYALPMFSVSDSVGDEFRNHLEDGWVTGYIDQVPKLQTRQNPGVYSRNVIAYKNISHSPNDAIVVISNRLDGWWGQTPGDSGAGGAMVLGIAKYMKDNNIIPKYNLAFLFTTGEEYIMRGALHFIDTHPKGTGQGEYNYKAWIGFEQLGFKQPITTPQQRLNTSIRTKDDTSTISLINAIADQTNYEARTGGQYNFAGAIPRNEEESNSEDFVWRFNCDNTILFEKGDGWNGWHRTGNNYLDGDSMHNMDRNDVNITAELAWNITKYFCVNPNCWFSNISFTSFDSPNDGDTLNDSILANFTIHSILPSDKVRVELNLSVTIGGVQFNLTNAGHNDYTLTSRSQNESIVFTIPDVVSDGYFSASLNLYNSTGLINRIVYGSPGYNDSSNFSEWYHLYHPLGYTKVGNSEQSVENRICGSVFTANENGWADNITAFINQIYMSPGPYQCMLYRANDGVLIGNTTSAWVSLPQGNPASSAWWAVFNFTGQKPYLVNGTQYIITCWGNNSNSIVSYTDSGLSSTGRYANQTYDDVPPYQVNFSNVAKFYSIYCSYTPVSPTINNVTATPHAVGFGYNVTIMADVFDNESGISQVKVHITPPGEVGGEAGNNHTMTHGSGDTYYYVYNDTWITGQYDYTIWAISNQSHMNTSSGHHFHVSADAAISIATLKDTYSGEEYINITDPPNPPENLSLVARGLTWDKYYNAVTGNNILEVSTGPINYQEENGTWTPINTTINQLATNHPAYVYGYRAGNNQGLFGAYFKANIQNEWPVAFTYSRSNDPTVYAVRSKLLGVGYVDPASNWSYQYLQNVQSSQVHTNGNIITYENVFNGTNVTWTYDHTGLKEKIILSNATKTVLASHPPSYYGLQNESSYLVIITKLEHQNLNLYTTSGALSGNVTVNSTIIDFKDTLGQIKCALPLGEAYELHNESARQNLTYRIIHLNGNTYLLSGLKISDLTMMTFPVVVDPTIIVDTSISDGFVYRSGSNYNDIWSTEEGTVSSDDESISIGQTKTAAEPFTNYVVYRGFLFFDTSELPTNANIMNATLSVYKKNDYSSTDFMITVQNGQPTYPNDPLEEGDYDKKHYSGNGGSLNTASFVNGTNNITLTNFSWITVGDITKFCLRSNRDINGTTPAGPEYITISSANIQGEPNPDPRPKLLITYRNQSKIKNTGSTDIKGYLLMQVQYYDTGQFPPHWIVDNDVVNETWPRTITNGNQLALDLIFNDMIRASDLTHGTGNYRVYAAFHDPGGNILRTDDAVELVSWWGFTKTE